MTRYRIITYDGDDDGLAKVMAPVLEQHGVDPENVTFNRNRQRGALGLIGPVAWVRASGFDTAGNLKEALAVATGRAWRMERD